jgi:hypothetical protein
MAGARKAAYRALAEEAVQAQARTAAGLEQVLAEMPRASASTEHDDREIARQKPA